MEKIQFLTPIDGTMVCDKAGMIDKDALLIDITLHACAGRKITINGLETTDHGGYYTIKFPLTAYENKLIALDEETGDTTEATIYRLKDASMKYRLSFDDNIWFMQDIAKNNYKSLFENPYLKLIKDMNDKYGTKMHINLYYCCSEFGGFNLAQFPDKYKSEWEDVSDWLKLSFHAFKNLPDEPYLTANYKQAIEECQMVNKEILRFAGEKSLSEYTTIHWCRGPLDACKAFRESGYTTLQGGTPHNYYIPDDLFDNTVRKYGYYYDAENDLAFTLGHINLNKPTIGPDKIPDLFYNITHKYPLNGFLELVIHEQYFYPHFHKYLPDYRERIETGIKWCIEHGYESSFKSDFIKPW